MTNQQKASKILDYDEEHKFWKGQTSKDIVEIHRDLLSKGLTDLEAKDIIQSIWFSACGEYGD